MVALAAMTAIGVTPDQSIILQLIIWKGCQRGLEGFILSNH